MEIKLPNVLLRFQVQVVAGDRADTGTTTPKPGMADQRSQHDRPIPSS